LWLGEGLAWGREEDGFALAQVQALLQVSLDEPKMTQLQRYVATECYHRDRSAQLSCPVLDLYLDGITGRGDYSVECAPRPGAIVTRLRSIALLRKPNHIFEVSKDKANIVTNRTLSQILAGG